MAKKIEGPLFSAAARGLITPLGFFAKTRTGFTLRKKPEVRPGHERSTSLYNIAFETAHSEWLASPKITNPNPNGQKKILWPRWPQFWLNWLATHPVNPPITVIAPDQQSGNDSSESEIVNADAMIIGATTSTNDSGIAGAVGTEPLTASAIAGNDLQGSAGLITPDNTLSASKTESNAATIGTIVAGQKILSGNAIEESANSSATATEAQTMAESSLEAPNTSTSSSAPATAIASAPTQTSTGDVGESQSEQTADAETSSSTEAPATSTATIQ